MGRTPVWRRENATEGPHASPILREADPGGRKSGCFPKGWNGEPAVLQRGGRRTGRSPKGRAGKPAVLRKGWAGERPFSTAGLASGASGEEAGGGAGQGISGLCVRREVRPIPEGEGRTVVYKSEPRAVFAPVQEGRKGCIGRKTLAWWQGYPCARNHLQDTCGFMAEMAKAVLGGQMATDRYLGAYVCGPKPSVWRFICQKFPSYSAIHMSEVPVLLVRPVRPPGRPQRSSHFPLQETPPGPAFGQVPGPRGRHPGRPRLQAPRKASATSKDQGGARTKNTRIKLRAYPCRRPRGRAP